MKIKCLSKGFSLIEITSFIVVIGLAVTGALIALQQATQYSSAPNATIQAQAVARSHLAFIRLSRHINGYAGVSDPCQSSPALSACIAVQNYASTHGLTASAPNPVDNGGRKRLTISISGNASYQMQYEAVNHEGA